MIMQLKKAPISMLKAMLTAIGIIAIKKYLIANVYNSRFEVSIFPLVISQLIILSIITYFMSLKSDSEDGSSSWFIK